LNSARDQQIRALYRAALERAPAERPSFVAELSGGDEELRRSVESLLSQHGATDMRDEGSKAATTGADLPAGTRLGHYRIDGVVGRGGMGVVYRATDTRLGRSVAIKFLSVSIPDEAVKRRFEQEAKTASALNHPHLVTVYDVGEHDGRQYIVSELVDGGSLADWAAAARKRNWRQSVELLAGVADGIASAHAAGVLHRDIKPGNVLIGSNGYAKLGDFGLAKLVRKDTNPAEVLKSSGDTREGVVVGTVAYMSPEQASGQPLDARSDVFSFGIVLYELLAGRSPFEASNELEMLKKIMYATPEPLPDGTPDLLRMAVDKALEKDPRDRYQTMQDMAADLRRVSRKPTSSQTTMAVSSDAQALAGIVKRHRTAVLGTVVALVLALGGLAYLALARLGEPSATSAEPAAARDYEITPLTTGGDAALPAISPDGKYSVYVKFTAGGETSLWVRQVETGSNQQLLPPEAGASLLFPTISPDGNYVDFVRATPGAASIWRVPLLGGTPRRIAENVSSPAGWSADGRQVAFLRGDSAVAGELIVADEQGTERVLATRRMPRSFVTPLGIVGAPPVRPAWSPDGKTIALFEMTNQLLAPRVVFIDVATGSETSRDTQGSFMSQGLAWLGPAELVLSQPERFAQPAQLWRMSYPDGAVVPLTNDLNSYIGVDVDAARDSLVTTLRRSRASIWVGDAAATNGMEVAPTAPVDSATPLVAWAGGRVLYDTTTNGRATVVAVTPGRGAPEEVVANALHATATADGKAIIFVRSERGNDGLWKIDADGQRPRQIVTDIAVEPSVTPDDKYVIFFSWRGTRQTRWIAPLDGGEPRELIDSPNGVLEAVVSPDGRRLAFAAFGAQQFGLCDFPECANRSELPFPPNYVLGRGLRWTPDGREIAYIDSSRTNIWVMPLDGGAPRQLTRFEGGQPIASFAWSNDGAQIAILRTTLASDVVLFSGLKR
jgi:Tol biopolymer transport system component/predicted Ser/Thr protein kinase